MQKVNHHAFDILTEESLYWIGFLFADGSLESSKKRIVLQLCDKDLGHLCKYKEFVKSRHSIIKVIGSSDSLKPGNVAHKLQFCSENIYNKLRGYGMNGLNQFINPPICNSRDFWRGIIDGDGTVCKTSDGRVHLRLVGGYNTIVAFWKFCNIHITHFTSKITKHYSIFAIKVSGKTAKIIINYLYKDSKVFLERKNLCLTI